MLTLHADHDAAKRYKPGVALRVDLDKTATTSFRVPNSKAVPMLSPNAAPFAARAARAAPSPVTARAFSCCCGRPISLFATVSAWAA